MERQAQQAVREDRGLEKERQPERAAAAQLQVQSAARAAAVLRMGGAAVRLRAEDVLNPVSYTHLTLPTNSLV